jgi:hypothetical protein
VKDYAEKNMVVVVVEGGGNNKKIGDGEELKPNKAAGDDEDTGAYHVCLKQAMYRTY